MRLKRAAQSLIYRTTGRLLIDARKFNVVPKEPSEPQTSGFFGDYRSFAAAAAECGVGYDDPEISSAVEASRRKSVDAAIAHIDERFISPLAAISLAISRLNKTSVSVLDFGGGNGALAAIIRHYLPNTAFDWTVVETPSMVDACQSITDIRWLTEIPHERFDIVLFCGSLQCIPDPHPKLEKAASLAPWIVIQRIFLGPCDRITKFVPPPSSHSGAYPIAFFGEQNFVAALNRLGNVEMAWTVEVERYSYPFDSVPRGFLIKSRSAR